MSLLALDLGTNTGFAIATGKSKISGAIDFAPKRFEGGGMRYLKFRRWLDQTHEAAAITEVTFEEVRRHQGTDAAHVYGGFLAALCAWCEEHNIPYEGVPVQTIKKFATGKGHADKAAVMAAVKEKWGIIAKSDDEADAIALLHFKLYDILN